MQYRKENMIGKGSSRTVYDSGKVVHKVVDGRYRRTLRGLAQNRAEYEIWRYATSEHGVTHLCPIIDITPNDERLVMRKAIPLSEALKIPELQEKVRLLKRQLRYFNDATVGHKRHEISPKKVINEYKGRRQEEVKRFFRSKLYHDLKVLVYDYALTLGDVVRPSSWGYLGGKFVLIDYGLTRAVYKDYYCSQRGQSRRRFA